MILLDSDSRDDKQKSYDSNIISIKAEALEDDLFDQSMHIKREKAGLNKWKKQNKRQKTCFIFHSCNIDLRTYRARATGGKNYLFNLYYFII